VREYIKDLLANVDTLEIDVLETKIKHLIDALNEMIFKEEEILLPMAEEYLTQDEWYKIQEESDEIGYAFIDKPDKWIPEKIFNLDTEDDIAVKDGLIRLETGLLSLKQLEAMLNSLPIDITFIDDKNIVRYFS